MSSLLVSGELPDRTKKTPVWLAAGEASSKAAVTAAYEQLPALYRAGG
jgi:hypothetical protein